MKLKRSVSGLFLTVLCWVSVSANAAVITSVDRATFAAAVAGGAIASENFEGIAIGTILTTTPDVSYGASLGLPIVTSDFLTSTSPNGLGSTSAGFFVPGESATFTFSAPITAFAIDINTFADTDGAYQVTIDTGDEVTSLFEVFPSQATGQFIGFVSDTPFTSVVLSDVTGFSYTLDTLVYGDAAAVVVPIPGALVLMLSALSAFGWKRRR